MSGPGPRGAITLAGDTATLTFVRRLPHPVAEVWAAITEPGRRAEWFGATTIEPRAGGLIEMDPEDPPAPLEMKHMRGRILVWDPPHVLEHEWNQAIVEPGVVRYELVPDGDGTLLTFTHRGLGVRNAHGFAPGTHAFLDRLAAFLAGEPLPAWMARFHDVQGEYGPAPGTA